MKIYIAARYSRRDEMRVVAQKLEEMGHIVTSTWLRENNPLDCHMGDDTQEFYRRHANVDLIDIEEAGAMLFFAEDPKVGVPRGGRHVEFGYALALGLSIFVIGPHENIFHYASPRIKHIETVEEIGVARVAYRR
jgi:hypothetical protein